jgi:uncharacterized protein (TIGR02145 family)
MTTLATPADRLKPLVTSLLLCLFLLAVGCSSGSDGPSRSSQNLQKGSFTDPEGNTYVTVKIGDQWWMAENLRVTRYRNGDPIDHTAEADTWFNSTAGAWCHVENNPAFTATYGLLYNGFAVNDPRGLAPDGWHIPSDQEWQTLVSHLGPTNPGGKAKAVGTSHWFPPNLGATNESGFSGLPAGVRPPIGSFTNRGEIVFFWTTTVAIPPPVVHLWLRGLGYAETEFRHQMVPLQMGLSVRCVMD